MNTLHSRVKKFTRIGVIVLLFFVFTVACAPNVDNFVENSAFTEETTVPPTDPTTVSPTEPTAAPPTEPTTAPPTEPTTVPPTEPTTVPPTEPTTAPPTEPTTVPPTEPTTAPPTEPTTAPPTESTTVPPTEPTTAPTTQPPVTSHTHSWNDATCTSPKTCSACGATEGRATGHNWKDATCTDPKICTICGTTSGSTAEHNFSSGTCSTCGTAAPDSNHTTLVWIPTKGGKKYHTHAGCSNMIDPEQVTQSEAESRGFTPCKRCH